MNTQEQNKLIAEFIKAEKYPPNDYDIYGCITMANLFADVDCDDEDTKHFYTLEEMKFSSSWGWLMPIVEKIINLKTYLQPRNKVFQSINPDIKETYKSVIEFIQWYNTQKQ